MEGFTKIALLFAVLFFATYYVQETESCMCLYEHPQTQYCHSKFVAIVSVKKKYATEFENEYLVRVKKILKQPNNTNILEYFEPGSSKFMKIYTPGGSSCNVDFAVNGTYVIGNRIFDGKVEVSFCDLYKDWTVITMEQRRGFLRNYAAGCNCSIHFTDKFNKLGGDANNKLCRMGECEREYGVCVVRRGKCIWNRTQAYRGCTGSK